MKDYIGNELELFKHAHNWKKYYAKFIQGYLKNDVLEVGAGIGETTHSLCDATQNSWVCVEPDAQLTKVIAAKKENGYLPSFIEIVTDTLDGIETNRKFDAIIYIDVIEHIEKDVLFIRNSYYSNCYFLQQRVIRQQRVKWNETQWEGNERNENGFIEHGQHDT